MMELAALCDRVFRLRNGSNDAMTFSKVVEPCFFELVAAMAPFGALDVMIPECYLLEPSMIAVCIAH
jgi:hypothetical protein